MATDKPTQAAANTDRELWREREGDYYADSIHVTERGGIGIDCGGTVYVKPLREWHRLAATVPQAGGGTVPRERHADQCAFLVASENDRYEPCNCGSAKFSWLPVNGQGSHMKLESALRDLLDWMDEYDKVGPNELPEKLRKRARAALDAAPQAATEQAPSGDAEWEGYRNGLIFCGNLKPRVDRGEEGSRVLNDIRAQIDAALDAVPCAPACRSSAPAQLRRCADANDAGKLDIGVSLSEVLRAAAARIEALNEDLRMCGEQRSSWMTNAQLSQERAVAAESALAEARAEIERLRSILASGQRMLGVASLGKPDFYAFSIDAIDAALQEKA